MAPIPIWRPPTPSAASITTFLHSVNRRYSLHLKTYADLHAWSITNIPQFAESLFIFAGIKTSSPYTVPVTGLESGKMYPPPTWFPGARLNYTENLLAAGLALRPDGVAVTGCGEGGEEEDLTWRELERRTAVWADVLRGCGVGVGDRVAVILPNRIDCLLILLATGSIGAIFSSTSPDMGATGIVERYSQVKPKILICDTIVTYAGKKLDLRKRLAEANDQLREHISELRHTLVVNGPLFPGANVKLASTLLAAYAPKAAPVYEQLPFDHPIYILYTSGTTGAPKCITHAAGRALLQQKKDHLLSGDVNANSTYYQYTTTGWMMWNWVVAVLSIGGRIVLFDGSPLWPSPTSQLELIKKQCVTHWGTSPKFLAALKQHGLPEDMSLPSLLHVASAGSPLSAEMHYWFADKFPKGVGLFSGSGGTDLVSGIVSGSPITPLYPGEIAVPALGMSVQIWDSSGRDIASSGSKGDLVITKPFFSMPLGFWGTDGEKKYQAAYFEQFPGVWYHGDFIRRIPATGGYEILGRSDGVLNPGGVRFGSAEIYAILERLPELTDFLCVGQKLPPSYTDEQVVLFLKLPPGAALTPPLASRIKSEITRALSPRHVPAAMHQVRDIPYTVNGKRIENLVRDVLAGKEIGEARTASNPECLGEYRRFAVGGSRGGSKL
ncbi:hypothetical protein B2J93_5171 [Marssonina coronariae]|uniref:AMP-dependent synthetase/ligase domain-containing protein n=1 Tax=Diplocarpon coronariae TaxID=2795749 RepID=A0A218ZG10_9HELO|nr:hypothetical protein B2J93_5171 [Marssonina coronariae]